MINVFPSFHSMYSREKIVFLGSIFNLNKFFLKKLKINLIIILEKTFNIFNILKFLLFKC